MGGCCRRTAAFWRCGRRSNVSGGGGRSPGQRRTDGLAHWRQRVRHDLSGHVPRTLATALPSKVGAMLGGRRNDEINLWAVHGRSILDAIASTLELTEDALDVSRDILRRFGNMSSATITFVPRIASRGDAPHRGEGCLIYFAPPFGAEEAGREDGRGFAAPGLLRDRRAHQQGLATSGTFCVFPKDPHSNAVFRRAKLTL